MAVDRQGRDRLRNALLGFFQGYISNEVLLHESCNYYGCEKPTSDASLYAIAMVLFNISDARYEYFIWTRPNMSLEENRLFRSFILRTLAFLRTEEDISVELMFDVKKMYSKMMSKKYWEMHGNYWPFSSTEEVDRRRDEIADLSPDFQDYILAEYLAQKKQIRKFGTTDYVLSVIAILASVLIVIILFSLWIS